MRTTNSNNKKSYNNVNFNFAEEVPDNGEKIKSIVCFSVSPEYRGYGVATTLLVYLNMYVKMQRQMDLI